MVKDGDVGASDLLCEVVHSLLRLRNEKKESLEKKLKALRGSDSGEIVLSSEETVTLIQQHLVCKHASRLPVLIVAAAYRTAMSRIGERVLPLFGA